MELAIAHSDPNVVYVSAEGVGDSGLYRTSDGGNTWNAILNPAGTANWMGAQGWYNQTLAVDPYDIDHVFLGGVQYWEATIVPGTSDVRTLTRFEEINTDSLIEFVSFTSAVFFGGRLATGVADDQVSGVSEDDYVSAEIRFGPGQNQMAHRFTIPPEGGTAGDGGAGIALADYMYADYVEIPFEVWDIDNNVQLAVSFRDQAGDGVYNLLPRLTEGDYAEQSREYFFVHTYAYNESQPQQEVAADGGLANQMLYFMWPHLAEGGTWDPENLPESMLRITAKTLAALSRTTSTHPQSGAMHVDHHNIIIVPIDETAGTFKKLNANDGGVHFSENSGRGYNGVSRGLNTTQFYGVDKRPGFEQYIGGTQDNGTWRSFNRPHARQGWLDATPGDGFETVWHKEDDQLMLASSQYNTVWRTETQGRQWVISVDGLDDVGDGEAPFITKFANSGDYPDRVFMIGPSGVWRSEDFGVTWGLRRITEADWRSSSSLGQVKVALANPNEVWAGFRLDVTGAVTGKVHVSTDGGDTFSPVTVPGFAPQVAVSGLATHPGMDSTAFVLFSAYNRPKVPQDHGSWPDLDRSLGIRGSRPDELERVSQRASLRPSCDAA